MTAKSLCGGFYTPAFCVYRTVASTVPVPPPSILRNTWFGRHADHSPVSRIGIDCTQVLFGHGESRKRAVSPEISMRDMPIAPSISIILSFDISYAKMPRGVCTTSSLRATQLLYANENEYVVTAAKTANTAISINLIFRKKFKKTLDITPIL